MKTVSLQIFAVLFLSLAAYAQESTAPNKSSETYLKSVASKVDGNWAWFKNKSVIAPNDYFSQFKKSLGLTELDSMHLEKVTSDGFDFLIYRYQQFHKGIPVENAEYILEVRQGKVEIAHGHIADNINLPLSFGINEALALEKAKAKTGFAKFAWEIDSLQTQIKELKKDVNATWFPKAKIVYANLNPEGVQNKNYQLAYEFEVVGTGKERIPSYEMYVDAINGSVIKKIPKTKECFSHSSDYISKLSDSQFTSTNLRPLGQGTGTAIPLFARYGNPISFKHDATVNQNGLQLSLIDTQKGLLVTRYWNSPSSPITTYNINGQWNSNNQDATTLHWAVEKSYDYFSPYRQGMNGSNNTVIAYAKWGAGVNNAQYYNSGGQDYIRCGQTPSGTDVISLDIVGHEYTHGVTHYTSGLLYQGFAGALNESFSDMLGTMVEYSVLGNNGYNFLVGEDVFPGGLRDMQTPTNHQQPGIVGGSYWINPVGCNPDCDPYSPGYNDCCYVHTNSGIPNRWFYLVATRQDPQPQIGNAGFVAYGTLVRLTGYSDFNDARNASIEVASYYFGMNSCNSFARDVTNAWAAVGVGNVSTCPGRLAAIENTESSVNKGYPVAYPNPVSDVLNVQLRSDDSSLGEKLFSIYNLAGKKVAEVKSNEYSGTLDVSLLPTGIYLLHVTSTEGNKISTIMKQQVIISHY